MLIEFTPIKGSVFIYINGNSLMLEWFIPLESSFASDKDL